MLNISQKTNHNRLGSYDSDAAWETAIRPTTGPGGWKRKSRNPKV